MEGGQKKSQGNLLNQLRIDLNGICAENALMMILKNPEVLAMESNLIISKHSITNYTNYKLAYLKQHNKQYLLVHIAIWWVL